ncbi:hypothetical protein IGW14_20625 [Streptomyces hygroscopicus subsp. hygroscopicus]|uniref:Uncharacterized protein n=1 Tax=Streptomyces demainii TaxID=588122 RepID=A0ABT9L0X3_9ACTN|nr:MULTISPECIES: hypothetical protein [Streptomyces]MBW8090355.1 hypothetical protein [Streptomyces hygroscopicus subsp. hygroscopicus]MDP9613251.1 hypothetical protein [Streptomyces demainii]
MVTDDAFVVVPEMLSARRVDFSSRDHRYSSAWSAWVDPLMVGLAVSGMPVCAIRLRSIAAPLGCMVAQYRKRASVALNG